MPESAPKLEAIQPRGPFRHLCDGVGGLLCAIVKRTYALVLIVIVLGLSFLAFRYLIVSLILPAKPPPVITGLPQRLDIESMSREFSAYPAVTATEHARSPLAHYHRMVGWFEPDHFNDCARSGCHNQLPHSKDKALRAFLNMHATSIQCNVCHMQHDSDGPLALTWYDLSSGRAADPPALLRAYAWLTEHANKNPAKLTTDDQELIVALMRQAADASHDEPALVELTRHLEAVRPGSAPFAEITARAAESFPRFFRGEYGEKIALRDDNGRPILRSPDAQPAIEAFLRSGTSAPPAQREKMLAAVHPHMRKQPRICSDCHNTQGELVDFAALGYPEPRIDTLVRHPMIMQVIERISHNESLYLPQFVAPTSNESPPETNHEP